MWPVRAVVQRVSQASVTVAGQVTGQIRQGLLVLVGVGAEDGPADADALAEKIATLRIFEDDGGKMNRSVQDLPGAGVLAVSQFTLFGDCRKGRRPSFTAAMAPDAARALFDRTVERLRALGLPVGTGVFGAHMDVALVNDGPVTLLLDTRRLF